jgi:hypothetical protein
MTISAPVIITWRRGTLLTLPGIVRVRCPALLFGG